MHIIYTDGTCKGNPGLGSFGYLIEDSEGKVIKSEASLIGMTTNNIAEYRAVIEALRTSEEIGIKEIRIISDSLLIVNQILGLYKVKKQHLRKLREEVMDLLNFFDKWEIEHVPREYNAAADMLANSIFSS